MKNKQQKNKGFTLIELLVVVAIIAILSTIVIVSINAARAKGKDSGAISQLNQARNQAEIYYTKTGSYNGLCSATSPTSEEVGIYEYVLAAAEAIGFDPPENYVQSLEVSGGYAYPAQGYGVYYARCHVAQNDFLNPRWAAQVPLLKKDSDDRQQFYCVDSTGEGVVTTVDLGDQTLSSATQYLECIPTPEQ